ncbi:MAG: alpha/beta fold hydrolase [Methyloligellaceae bacterium]
MTAKSKKIIDGGAARPWLTMVHGMSHDHRVFSEQVSAFRESYRILLVDLPGHGLSAGIPGPFGHQELADHVLAALDEANISATHYWGTHTGTALGLLLALRHPHRFFSLILEGAVLPGRPMRSVMSGLRDVQDIAQNRSMDEARRFWFENSAWFDVIRRRPAECRAEDHWAILSDFPGKPWVNPGRAAPLDIPDDELKMLGKPLLLYNGEHDVADFIEAADQLESLLPAARRAVISEAGGFPAWEFPDRTNEVVERFLAHLEPD